MTDRLLELIQEIEDNSKRLKAQVAIHSTLRAKKLAEEYLRTMTFVRLQEIRWEAEFGDAEGWIGSAQYVAQARLRDLAPALARVVVANMRVDEGLRNKETFITKLSVEVTEAEWELARALAE